ncbi:MAG: hypothetical protein NTV06_01970 [candidate division Zixibacteria bacterium]|nr:hypothetical protein [candidate division Zixibacteria bacterium]
MEIKSYIEELFKYLDAYEKRPAEFETEAFLQTYNGIYAVFQALRQQRDKAVEVDQFFFDKIKQVPLTGSDLRRLSIQIMITYFESEADIDGQSNRSYLHCRGLREVKQDVPFFENYLIPLLVKEGNLNNNFRLNLFFLNEIARYINKFGRATTSALTPEEFGALSDSMKFLELARRRSGLGSALLKDRNSLEFHLQRINAFDKLGQKNKLFEHYLTEWIYLKRTSFWSKVTSFWSELIGKIKGAFSSSRYFRLVMTQRNAAHLYYFLIIIFFILLAIYVPIKWRAYSDKQLQEFQDRAMKLQSSLIK